MKAVAETNERGEFVVGPLSCWSWIGKGWPYYEGRFCRHEDDVSFINEEWMKLSFSHDSFASHEIPLSFDVWSEFDPEMLSSHSLGDVFLNRKYE